MQLTYSLVILFILILSGCATAPTHPAAIIAANPVPPAGMQYHRVERGQTLWRISKIYGVDLDELTAFNRIADVTNIEVGQLLLIPREAQSAAARPVVYALPAYKKTSDEDFAWPVKGSIICRYGQSLGDMINKGLNIQPQASYDVAASRSGKVIFYAPNLKGYGKTVIIDHGDGFSTVYARNSEVLVEVGDVVRRGSVIAKVGRAGRNREAYLHFEIRKGHVPQNPTFYLP